MTWISLSEAERRVRLRVTGHAREEILQKLRWGELLARAERYELHLVRRNSATRENKSYLARDRKLFVLNSDFWTDNAVNFEEAMRWDESMVAAETSGFASLCSIDDYRLRVTNIHVVSETIDKLWPASPSKTSTKPHRPPGRGLDIADSVLVARMQEMVASGEAPSPTAAAWALIGKDGQGAKGNGTPESKVRRLVRRLSS